MPKVDNNLVIKVGEQVKLLAQKEDDKSSESLLKKYKEEKEVIRTREEVDWQRLSKFVIRK